MRLQVYSIFDKKGQAFERPFHCKHVAEATRAVQSGFSLPDDQKPWYVKYPADYALYLVGYFDMDTGLLSKPTGDMPQFTIEVASLAPFVPPQIPTNFAEKAKETKFAPNSEGGVLQ